MWTHGIKSVTLLIVGSSLSEAVSAGSHVGNLQNIDRFPFLIFFTAGLTFIIESGLGGLGLLYAHFTIFM